MNKTVLISMDIKDLESLIISSVNTCLDQLNIHGGSKQNELLNVQQAAEFLNLSVPTIYTKVSKSELPFMKRGKRLYFTREDLFAYLKAGKVLPQSEIKGEEFLKGGRK